MSELDYYPNNGVPLLPVSVPTIDNVPDLRLTEVNTVSEVTSNIAGDAYDPYAPIHKQELYNQDSFQSRAYNVKVMTTTGDYTEVGIVGADYLLVENKELQGIGEDIRQNSGHDWEHNRTFFNGKQYRNIYTTDNLSIDIPGVGDVVRLMMTEQNSYDKSLSAGVRWDFIILACLNGMTSSSYGWSYKFRHTMGNVDWQEEVIRAGQILKNQAHGRLTGFANACAKLNTPLDIERLREVRQDAIPKLPPLRFGQIADRYFKDGGETMWDFMNAGTATLWHKDKMTVGDFTNNERLVDGLLDYAGKVLA